MNQNPQPGEGTAAMLSSQPLLSRRSANDRQWESLRAEIHQFYVVEKHNLRDTMRMMKEKYNFRPSERKYKEKLKEWKLEKNLSAADREFIFAKSQARAREEGKCTVFYNNGVMVTAERIETFKKREKGRLDGLDAPDSMTPANITYHTPHPGSDGDMSHVTCGIGDGVSVAGDTFNLPEDLISILPASCAEAPSSREDAVVQYDSTFNENYTTPSCATDSALMESENFARDQKKAGNLSEAASEYIRLLDEYTRKKGCNSLPVYKTLSNLAEIYQAQNLLDKSANAYRKVVAGYGMLLGRSSLVTLRKIQSLAKVLEEFNEYEEAECLYRQALLGFEGLGLDGEDDLIDCKLFLGALLCDLDRPREARRLLESAFRCIDRLGLHHRRIIVLGSLLEIYIQLEFWILLRFTISRMHEDLDKHIELDQEPRPEVLSEGIHLAATYSDLFEYDAAQSLFDLLLPKLDLLINEKYRTEKYYGYLECGYNHLRQGHLEEANVCFSIVDEDLRKLNRPDDSVAELVRIRFVELRAMMPGGFKNEQAGFSQIEPEDIVGISREAATSEGEIQHIPEANSDMEISSDMASKKYGLTFSASDITGISLSEFMTP